MRFDIFSLFPGMFESYFSESILKRAQERALAQLQVHDIRDWTSDRHKTADDTPYGGGAGMVMKVEPIVTGVEAVLGADLPEAKVLLMSAGGVLFDQQMAHDLSTASRIVIICGRYEGVDERVPELLNATPVSVGNFVMTGGELPAMAVTDAVVRLIPGVIDAASVAEESHAPEGNGLVEYPHYTRPREFRGSEVPQVLLNGNHAEIAQWREDQARKRTERWRPDLLRNQ